MNEAKAASGGWKPKLMHELKLIGAIALSVWLTLTGLQLYVGMVTPGHDVSNFQLGYNAIEALVQAKGMIHGGGFSAAFQDLLVMENGERTAHAAFMFIAFIPLFAIWETAHAIGEKKLGQRFFGGRSSP